MINTEYKDRLFSFLFGREENKEWTLSLYNAVNGSDYTKAEDIEITTIKEVLYLGMHNDVSFLIINRMNLYEQQSTFNPNMPLRQLQYSGNLYEKHIKEHKLNKYGERLIPLPVPKLVTFYNGREDQPDEMILRLSDSFPPGSDGDIEVKVRMININYGRNKQLMESCQALNEYSWLVQRIRDNQKKEMDIEEAVDKAIQEMTDDFLLKPFLEAHKAEVKGMLLTEYNEAETMELFRRDGIKEGMEKGKKEGVKEGRKEGGLLKFISQCCRKLKRGKSVEEIADDLEAELSEVLPIVEAARKCAPDYDEERILELLNHA